MLFAEKTRIDEYVIEILDEGSLNGPLLLKRVLTEKGKISKEAFYKSLRQLLKNEVINKTDNKYSLNRTWLRKIYDFSEKHIRNKTADTMHILEFEDGDSATYKFKSPFLLDIIWAHIFDIVFEANPSNKIMLNYHPHEWLILSRTETEIDWLQKFNKQRKMFFFNIGGNTELDKKFKQDFQSKYIKINTGISYTLKQNQYLSVVGDYVFEITTDMKFEKRVQKFFEENKVIDEMAQKQIHAISKQKYKSKLKLSKNKKKADMWRRRFKKDFYIPEPYYLFEKDE